MILQTQYKWYKWILYGVIFAIVGLIGMGGLYYVRGKLYEKDINKKVLEISSLQEEIQQAKNNTNYKIYKIGDVIYSQENQVNYAALYKYLNQIRNYILKDLRNYTISRFILSIKPKEVNIDTTLPNYNVIYYSGGLIDLLERRPFVEKIEANNFKKVLNGINVKLQIETK